MEGVGGEAGVEEVGALGEEEVEVELEVITVVIMVVVMEVVMDGEEAGRIRGDLVVVVADGR